MSISSRLERQKAIKEAAEQRHRELANERELGSATPAMLHAKSSPMPSDANPLSNWASDANLLGGPPSGSGAGGVGGMPAGMGATDAGIGTLREDLKKKNAKDKE